MSGLPVSACRACGWRGFPERIWCPACGGGEVDAVPAGPGVVEDATAVRRAPGRTLVEPVRLGTVALDGGGRVVARLEAEPGVRVGLSVEDGAPVARPDA
ncbi:MAG TPA: OB-fold domain-containing protein [Gaiellaceae bacterium]|nr:OB-fold domain-containing protein [Gaiellaceae bacterium]